MGMSLLISLKATILFLAFIGIKDFGFAFIHFPILHASLVAYLVALASLPAINLPLLLGKSSDGTFPLWSMLIFGPYLVFIRIVIFVRSLKNKEPLYNMIADGLYVGGWPSSSKILPPGDVAVVDCTCELPRSYDMSRTSYLCIATWDTRAPLPAQIESAVRWACRQRSQRKTIYVHCAFGHGRSVCVMCALLVTLGLTDDWKQAEKMIREKRPSIRMNRLHRVALAEWSKHRLSFRTSKETCFNSGILSNSSPVHSSFSKN